MALVTGVSGTGRDKAAANVGVAATARVNVAAARRVDSTVTPVVRVGPAESTSRGDSTTSTTGITLDPIPDSTVSAVKLSPISDEEPVPTAAAAATTTTPTGSTGSTVRRAGPEQPATTIPSKGPTGRETASRNLGTRDCQYFSGST
jgi:hypothetical protein